MPNLNIDQVASNQNQKEVTINDQAAQLDSALTDRLVVDLSAAGATITALQWTRNWFFELTGHTVARSVTIPATKRPAVVKNAGTAAVTLQITDGGSAIVPSGQTVFIYNDGVNVASISGLPDAPADGKTYSRKDNAWVDTSGDTYWSKALLSDFDVYDLSTLSAVAQARDGISLSTPNQGGRVLELMYKGALPAADWMLEVEMRVGAFSANYQGAGAGFGAISDQSSFTIAIVNNITSFWSRKLVGGITSGASAESLGTTRAGLVPPAVGFYGVPFVIKIIYQGGNFEMWGSVDGGNTYRLLLASTALTYVYPAGPPSDVKPCIVLTNSSSQLLQTLITRYKLQAL